VCSLLFLILVLFISVTNDDRVVPKWLLAVDLSLLTSQTLSDMLDGPIDVLLLYVKQVCIYVFSLF
jgi:hypothetical protein